MVIQAIVERLKSLSGREILGTALHNKTAPPPVDRGVDQVLCFLGEGKKGKKNRHLLRNIWMTPKS